jgi:hypothetical protein
VSVSINTSHQNIMNQNGVYYKQYSTEFDGQYLTAQTVFHKHHITTYCKPVRNSKFNSYHSIDTQQSFAAEVNNYLNNALHSSMNVCIIFQTNECHVCALRNMCSLLNVLHPVVYH